MENLINKDTAEVVAQVGTNRLKEMFSKWKNERMQSMKSWSLFCDKTKLSFPKITDIVSRLKSNLIYFQTNYVIVFLVLGIYSMYASYLNGSYF